MEDLSLLILALQISRNSSLRHQLDQKVVLYYKNSNNNRFHSNDMEGIILASSINKAMIYNER